MTDKSQQISGYAVRWNCIQAAFRVVMEISGHPSLETSVTDMESPHEQAESRHSDDMTVFDSSAPPSLKSKLEGRGERRTSSEPGSARSQSSASRRSASLKANENTSAHNRNRYGWPRLAEIMAQVPEFAAFPRYRELNVKNLLYYQVELELLRQQIESEEEEETVSMDRLNHIVEDGDTKYHKLLMKLRILLREYSTYRLFATKSQEQGRISDTQIV